MQSQTDTEKRQPLLSLGRKSTIRPRPMGLWHERDSSHNNLGNFTRRLDTEMEAPIDS